LRLPDPPALALRRDLAGNSLAQDLIGGAAAVVIGLGANPLQVYSDRGPSWRGGIDWDRKREIVGWWRFCAWLNFLRSTYKKPLNAEIVVPDTSGRGRHAGDDSASS
jgi:hypothetical protein